MAALVLPWRAGVLGGGDVKLSGLLAAAAPTPFAFALAAAFALAYVFGIARRLFLESDRFSPPLKAPNEPLANALPFAPFLLIPYVFFRFFLTL